MSITIFHRHNFNHKLNHKHHQILYWLRCEDDGFQFYLDQNQITEL